MSKDVSAVDLSKKSQNRNYFVRDRHNTKRLNGWMSQRIISAAALKSVEVTDRQHETTR